MFALFMVLSRANMFTLFYVTFSRANVFTLFLVPSRANMFTLFMLFFLERMCFRCLLYFHERICLRCFMLFSSSKCVCAISWFFHERMCLRCLWHLIICLRCYDAFLLANMFSLLYVFLWECVRSSASNVFAFFIYFLRANAFLLLVLFFCYLRDLGLRDLFYFCLSCVWLNQISVAALSVKIDALQKQASLDSVDRAQECVRQLAGRPVGLSDGTAIVAALERLADVSRSAGHVDYKRHEAVLKQCRPLTHDPRLPAIVTQLLGDDENKKIAGQIQKILKSDHLFSAPRVHGSPFPAPAGVPGYLRQQGSGRGRYTPYGYGSYNNNYAGRDFNTTRRYNCPITGHRIANCPVKAVFTSLNTAFLPISRSRCKRR